MKKLRCLVLLVLLLVIPASACMAAEEWVDDFDRICALTNAAGDLSKKELEKLVAECDILKTTISGSDSPKKKVYLFRLKKCRNFFEFMLTTKSSQ